MYREIIHTQSMIKLLYFSANNAGKKFSTENFSENIFLFFQQKKVKNNNKLLQKLSTATFKRFHGNRILSDG